MKRSKILSGPGCTSQAPTDKPYDRHFVCELCKREHGSKEDLDTHFKNHHNVPALQGTERYIMMDLDCPIGKEEEISGSQEVGIGGEVSKISKHEAEILTKLKHPIIIKLRDTFVHEEKHHLVLELMENDLQDIIKEPSTLSRADCKAYIQMMLKGLAYLHENSIIHEDLKCDNILVGRDGQLKLADFGLARHLEDGQAHHFENDIFEFEEIVRKLLRVVGSKYQSNEEIYGEFDEDSTDVDLIMSKVFTEMGEDFLDLYEQMFDVCDIDRSTPQQALQHRYFTSEPLPTPAHLIPRKARSTS